MRAILIHHRKLLGEAPKQLYRAYTGEGAVVEPDEVIFPILRQEPSGDLYLVGTGFFIAENGIFVTAKHVVTSVFDHRGVPTQPLGILQFGPSDTYYQRPVHRCTRHPIADVAVGVAWPMRHKTTGRPLPNKLFTLATSPPPTGSLIATYAYPKSTILHGVPQEVTWSRRFSKVGLSSVSRKDGTASYCQAPAFEPLWSFTGVRAAARLWVQTAELSGLIAQASKMTLYPLCRP